MRNVRVIGALAILATVLASRAHADDVRTLFRRANRSFQSGDHVRACTTYRALLEAHIEDPVLYYDLAVCEARDQRYGRAALLLERALVISPGDTTAQRAIDEIKRRIALREHRDPADLHALDISRGALMTLGRKMPINVLLGLILGLNAVFFVSLHLLRKSRREWLRVSSGAILAVSAVMLAGMLVLLFARDGAFERGRPGVVVARSVTLRAGPDESADAVGELIEGQRVRILSHEGAFKKVETQHDKSGWIKASQASAI
jgi:hypothetical protein